MNVRIHLVSWLLLATIVVGAASGQAPVKPLGEGDLASMLGLGLDDETIVAKIKKGGLAFDLTETTLQKFKGSGASPAVVQALQDAAQAKAQPTAAPAAGAVTYDQVLQMLALGIDEEGVLKRLAKSPTVFTLDAGQVAALKQAGATPKVLEAMARVRAAPAGGDVSDLALILDCSGSMRELTTGGETKMAVAKRVMTDLVSKIPAGLNVTFVLYGHEVFGGADDPRNCQAVKVARPLAPLDDVGRSELVALIGRLQPTGATPIALSLRTAGEELAKNNALCGVVLVTDGLESCKGDPAAEAAALVAKLNVSFGVNVVGFGVKAEENAALQSIANAGRGKYYAAADAKALTDAVAAIAQEIQAKAKPAEKKVTLRRAIIVHKPAIEEFPALGEIRLISRGLGSTSTDGKGGYEEEIRVPSATVKYEILWVPMDKEMSPVAILRDKVFAERKLVEIKPEDYLGMVRVNGKGKPKKSIVVSRAGGLGSTERATDCKRFGQIMVVPVGKWDIWIDDDKIEEGFEVEPGKLHELE